jgi:hypothetical protein
MTEQQRERMVRAIALQLELESIKTESEAEKQEAKGSEPSVIKVFIGFIVLATFLRLLIGLPAILPPPQPTPAPTPIEFEAET